MPNEYKNVWESWMIYDTVVIGDGVDEAQNWYASFAAMAAAPEVPFINVRTMSSVGGAYTNITSRDKFPWPFLLHSMGMRFMYPDPITDNSSPHTAIMAATKIFNQVLQEHSYFELEVREDVILRIKPSHMPAGMGPTGYVQGNNAANNWMATTITNGVPQLGNRWKFVGKAIEIPRDTPVRGRLYFSQYGRELLTALNAVSPLDFEEEENNYALIELTMLGTRGVQQRGELHYE